MMASGRDHGKVWKDALQELKVWTQVFEQLPPDDVIFKRAKAAVHKVTYFKPLGLALEDQVASSITAYIRDNFDPEKRRPPSKTNRKEREARDKLILTKYRSGEKLGKRKSIRHLAAEFDLSPSTVGRILRAHGVSPRQDVKRSALQTHSAAIVAIADRLLPKEGIRVVGAAFLRDQLCLTIGETGEPGAIPLEPLFDEISDARLALAFYPLGNEIVISRGRKLSPDQIKSWYEAKRPSAFLQPKRILQDFGKAVWSDLFSVVAVASQQATAHDWRVFLKCSVFTAQHLGALEYYMIKNGLIDDIRAPDRLAALICEDPEALVGVVNQGLQHWTDKGHVDSIRRKNYSYGVYSNAMSELLYFAEAADGCSLSTSVDEWMEVTAYPWRVSAGLMPGRNYSDIRPFLLALARADEGDEDLVDVLREFSIDASRV